MNLLFKSFFIGIVFHLVGVIFAVDRSVLNPSFIKSSEMQERDLPLFLRTDENQGREDIDIFLQKEFVHNCMSELKEVLAISDFVLDRNNFKDLNLHKILHSKQIDEFETRKKELYCKRRKELSKQQKK